VEGTTEYLPVTNPEITVLTAAVSGLLFNRWIVQHLVDVLAVAVALFVVPAIILVQPLAQRCRQFQ
jgi:undecaprenyl pyrophosphate phosphatase UppP